jgi:hypothetical protein
MLNDVEDNPPGRSAPPPHVFDHDQSRAKESSESVSIQSNWRANQPTGAQSGNDVGDAAHDAATW